MSVVDVEPEAYRELCGPREIKAFADPLRLRIVHLLIERRATNQQIAAELAEPPAKVFHHLRFLLRVGLVRVVEIRIRGKNVEKFYRAVARNFILRPTADLLPETRVATLSASLDRARHEAMESAAAWEADPPHVLRRTARLHADELQAFEEDLHALIGEYWIDDAEEEGNVPGTVLTVLMYRVPPVPFVDTDQSAEQSSHA